jgi:hypothetical protein
MTNKNTQAMIIAIIAGLLLLISGLSGLAAWETIKDFVLEHVGDHEIFQIVFVILLFIASLGGIAVIIGGLLIGKNKVGTGKFIIALGAGIGLIGLIISLVIGYMENSLTLEGFLSIGAIGIILSIIARMIAKNE